MFLREEQEETDPSGTGKRYKIVTLELVDALSGQSRVVLPPFEQRLNQGYNPIVAFSADATLLAQGSEEGNIHLWNLRTGKMLPTLRNSKLPIMLLRFSPDGKCLAAAGTQATKELAGDVALWDVVTGKRLALLPGKPEVPLRALGFSRSGQILATATGDWHMPKSSLQFWDVLTGKMRAQTGGGTNIDLLTFSPDDTLLVGGETEGALRAWNPRTAQALTTFAAGRQLTFPTYSPDGARIAAVAGNGFLQLWDATTGHLLDNFATNIQYRPDARYLETEPVFAPDGQSIAYVVSHKGSVEIYDVKTRMRRQIYAPDTRSPAPANRLLFAPDGKTLAVSASDLKTRFIDVATGKVLTTLDYSFSVYTMNTQSGERSIQAQFAADGKSFIGLRESTIVLYDLMDGQLRATIATGRYQEGIRLSDDGTLLAAMLDREVQIYDVATGMLKWVVKVTDGEYLFSVLLSPDGKRVLTRGSQHLRVWDSATGQVVSTLDITMPNTIALHLDSTGCY